MGLFHRNENDVNFAGGSRNIIEPIQRLNDVGALIYLDARQDFNTGSVITVAPNEQVIFIKNGEIYGVLPPGRHAVATENYAVLSRIRNMLSGGMSTFTCQVYHVSTSIISMNWGTSFPIQCEDHFLGDETFGVPTEVTGNGLFRLFFDVDENENAAVEFFKKLQGDKSAFTSTDLENLFTAQISQRINIAVGKTLSEISKHRSINGLSELYDVIADKVRPEFDKIFSDYCLRVDDFSFNTLTIEDTDMRRQILERRTAAVNIGRGNYDRAIQQELLKDLANNPGAGGVASAGAGLGMGMAAGNAFASMAATAFAQPTQQPVQQPQQSMGFGGNNRFGSPMGQPNGAVQQQQDPMEVLAKMKKLLDAGLISQQQYDEKVAEVLSRM